MLIDSSLLLLALLLLALALLPLLEECSVVDVDNDDDGVVFGRRVVGRGNATTMGINDTIRMMDRNDFMMMMMMMYYCFRRI